jgi:hypothetical protein
MSHEEHEPGVLPTDRVATTETVVLVRSLLVDWKVLDHLRKHGITDPNIAPEMRAECCKPDGGSCCVNKKGN